MTVDEVVSELERAWNSGDGDAWAARFAEDAEFVDVVGRVQQGRAVIAAEHQKIFDTIYRGSRIEIRAVSRRPVGAALVVRTESTLDVPAGPRAGTTRAIQTKVFRDGEIVSFHNTVRIDGAAFAGHDEELAARRPLGWDERRD